MPNPNPQLIEKTIMAMKTYDIESLFLLGKMCISPWVFLEFIKAPGHLSHVKKPPIHSFYAIKPLHNILGGFILVLKFPYCPSLGASCQRLQQCDVSGMHICYV